MKFTRSVDSILGLLRRKIISDYNCCSNGYYRWVGVDEIKMLYGCNHTSDQIRHHYNKLVAAGTIAGKLTTSGSRLYSLNEIDGYSLIGNYFITSTPTK